MARRLFHPWPSRARAGLLGVVALLLGVLAAPAHADDDGWWGGLDDGDSTRLEDVLAKPDDFRNRSLTFTVLFHARDKLYDPLRTIFNVKRYANFSAWPDGAAVWDQGPYERDHPFFYVPRSDPQHAELLALPVFTRLELTVRQRARIHGRPAFEVLGWRLTGHRMGESVVEGVVRGDNYARLGGRRNLELAASNYRQVLLRYPDLPPSYDMQVRRRLSDALRQLGYEREARQVDGGVPIVGAGRLPRPNDDGPVVPVPGGPGRGPLGFDDPVAPAGRGGDAWGDPDGPAAPPSRPAGDAWGDPDGGGAPTGALPPGTVPPGAVPPPLGFDDPVPPPVVRGAQDPGYPPVGPARVPQGDAPRPPAGTAARGPGTPAPSTAPPRRDGLVLPPEIPPQREPRLAGVK
jgi:hypothetical protein